MQSTTEMTPTETLIENAERQRRLLRRACWAGVAFVVAVILFPIGNSLFVRWQLRQRGWVLDCAMGQRGLPDWTPQWADAWFGKIECAHLERAPLRASDLESLQRFPNLDCMIFESTEVSESALAAMSQFPELSALVFNSVQLEPAGLRHFATHRKLDAMNFRDMILDDSALEDLATCHRLTGLRLTGVTDDNLRCLSRLSKLEGLGLLNCRMTDDGARRLVADHSSLRTLSIYEAPMTDTAMNEFARLPNLTFLELYDVPITDSGIQQIKSYPKLQTLTVKNTKLTPEGITELRRALPSLHVQNW